MGRDHGFHPVRITRIIQETPDTRTYVLDAPFPYRAGQFVTIKACGTLRSYSMSSSPETDTEFMTTVKRVPGGLVSNWMHDHLAPGDVVETTLPAGVFCLREGDEAGGAKGFATPVVAFCGGSGITPILSLAKSALKPAPAAPCGCWPPTGTPGPSSSQTRWASWPSGIRTGSRCATISTTGRGSSPRTRCGSSRAATRTRTSTSADPRPSWNWWRTRFTHGIAPERIFVERFAQAADPPPEDAPEQEGTLTLVLSGKPHTLAQRSGETFLESARRAGLAPPFSCEAGTCATCIAQVTAGEAKMRVNNALDEDEVAEGWVLTCQGEPTTPHVTVVYED